MPSKTFAKMRRGQQTINKLFVRLWIEIAHKGLDYLRCGRQPVQIKM